MSVYLGNNKVGIALPANLTSTTVSATEERQIVTPDIYRDEISYTSSITSHKAGSDLGTSITLSFSPTVDNKYRLIGTVEIIDSNNNTLETYNINAVFIWSTQSQSILTNDQDAYVSEIRAYKSGTKQIILTIYFNKTATYGVKINLNMYEFTGYNGFSQVIVEANPYTETWVKNWIQRSSNFTSIEWPPGLTEIGGGAFYDCNYFNCDALPDTITIISESAFFQCARLTLTELPNSLTSIGAYAFQYCSKITISNFPASLVSLGTYCFSGCTSISSINFLGNRITTIPTYCFRNCTSLTTVTLPNSVTAISSSAFELCRALSSINLPDSITNIGSAAFRNCTSLTNITCNGTITALQSYCFNSSSTYAMSLQSASFPNMTLTSTAAYSFGNTTAANACQQLAFVDLGSTKAIAANTFNNCYALQTLVLRRSDAICTLSAADAFTNTPVNGYNSLTATIYVPSALISTYQTATNWQTFYNNGTVTFAAIEDSQYEIT